MASALFLWQSYRLYIDGDSFHPFSVESYYSTSRY